MCSCSTCLLARCASVYPGTPIFAFSVVQVLSPLPCKNRRSIIYYGRLCRRRDHYRSRILAVRCFHISMSANAIILKLITTCAFTSLLHNTPLPIAPHPTLTPERNLKTKPFYDSSWTWVLSGKECFRSSVPRKLFCVRPTPARQ